MDRDYLAASLTGRYGLTDRLELEAKLPYVYRKDRRVATIPDVDGEAFSRTLDGDGVGDLELALHYQLGWRRPANMYYVGNLRYKTTTGRGPFDVSRNGDGIETELATGSGFHALEPSLTLLYPSDPAVFFANLGYLWHIKDDVDKTFGEQTLGEVDPGDAVRLSFGMGYSINPRASFTLGYKHDFIQETDTEINGVKLSTSSLDVGAMLLGYGFQLTDRAAVNLNLELGVTADAPDMVMTLRLPYSF
ncbi:transporter [Thiohalobacter thiocyanaticus]|uniref:transporter n=1 Tax=Thiohalobacter thiocyanaticus TaxID=585455 RepID=UPI0019D4D54C|nr:transporter [Thiohalobacter thiocyanaticus]